jgi:signal transduction histidine kinase
MGGVVGPITAEVEELVNIALANSERLMRIVDDILDLEKIERGTFVLRFEQINLHDALQNAIESNRGFALQHEVTLQLEAPDSTKNVRIHADPDRLAQIITNLISNAVKFSPAHATVLIRMVMTNPATARVEVHDAGPGVPPNFRSKLFQRFSQANASDTRRHSGTGLGLNITRELVGRMGGAVGYEPLEPSGSCFFAEFPILGTPQGGVGMSSSG